MKFTPIELKGTFEKIRITREFTAKFSKCFCKNFGDRIDVHFQTLNGKTFNEEKLKSDVAKRSEMIDELKEKLSR